jgi:hypothetical protein
MLKRASALLLVQHDAVADVVEHRVEIERRRLYLEHAYPSLYAFCVEHFGFSPPSLGVKSGDSSSAFLSQWCPKPDVPPSVQLLGTTQPSGPSAPETRPGRTTRLRG